MKVRSVNEVRLQKRPFQKKKSKHPLKKDTLRMKLFPKLGRILE